MPSILDRFRALDNLPQVIKFKFPPQTPAVEFTAKRAPEALFNIARINAEPDARKANGEDSPESRGGWVAYHLAEQLQPLVVGWRALDGGEMPAFNKSNLERFFKALDIVERMSFGFAYQAAVFEADDEQKKSTTAPTSPTDSSTPSDSESSTT